jgi:hypothetical protein
MTWLNPVALFGLMTVAVPILVHLFGKRLAKRQRFPSLRLLPRTAPTPTTRSQPSDLALLVVRCAIIALAALALAQPRWSQHSTGRQGLARVVIVDTSQSMNRLTSDGRSATALARELGQAMIDSAAIGLLVETSRPGRNVAAAAGWLEQQPGRQEIVVISDFQRGTVNEGQLALVRPGVGIALRRIPTTTAPPPASVDSSVIATMDEEETSVTWRVDHRVPATSLTILGSDSTSGATVTSARSLVPPRPLQHAIGLVFPDYAGVGQLISRSDALNQPWQGDFLLALRSDDLLHVGTNGNYSPSCEGSGRITVHNDRGQAVAAVASGNGGSMELLVFSCVEANSTAGAALVAAVTRAASAGETLRESEPVALPDDVLRDWERPATAVNPRGGDETSPDGRWLWLAVLLLIGVEEWVRRRTPRRQVSAAQAEGQERVA